MWLIDFFGAGRSALDAFLQHNDDLEESIYQLDPAVDNVSVITVAEDTKVASPETDLLVRVFANH